MKRFTLITGSILLLALAACANTQNTTAPGAVGDNKACCADKSAACCKESKSAKCDATAAPVAAPAAASPGAVSGQKKSGCGACPMSGKTNG